MISAALVFLKMIFGGMFSKILDGLKWLLEMVVKYPKQAAAIVLVAVAAYFFYGWAYDRGASSRDKEVAELKAKVATYEEQIRQQNVKIAKLETDSKAAADTNAAEVKTLNEKLGVMVTNYKLAVADAAKWKAKYANRDVVVVDHGGKPIEVRIQDNQVVCNRFYDEYVESVNTIVNEANKSMRGEK